MPITEPGTGVSGNGPKTGNGNRNRNTLRNNDYGYSGQFGFPGVPPLDPYSTFNYAQSLATLRQSYLMRLSGLKQTVKGAKSQYRVDKSTIKSQRREELGEAALQANERGMLGSSVDVETRSGVRASAAAALLEARRVRNASIASARLEKMGATNEYSSGAVGLQAQQAAQQAAEAANNFSSNLYDGNSPTGTKAGDVAASQLGVQYNWADSNPKGRAGGPGAAFDCSGLTKFVYQNAYGVSLPHMASAQQSMMNKVSQNKLRPGDLVFFNYGRKGPGVADHVGVYIGGGQMIDASSSLDRVVRRGVDWAHFLHGGRL